MREALDNFMNIFNKSMASGILIGMGVIINALTNNRALGAFLFSFALLTIIQFKMPLFTGRVGFLKKHLPTILFGNLIGVEACIGLYYFANPSFVNTLQHSAELKFAKSIPQMFFSGMLCGILIHFAVKAKHCIITMMAIMIFILIGAEHCIAAFPYLGCCFNLINLIKFVMIILGNSVGAIYIEQILFGLGRNSYK